MEGTSEAEVKRTTVNGSSHPHKDAHNDMEQLGRAGGRQSGSCEVAGMGREGSCQAGRVMGCGSDAGALFCSALRRRLL